MKDTFKILIILLAVLFIYMLFYMQDEIVNFAKKPLITLQNLSENTLLDETIKPQEESKVVIVEEESQTIKVVEESSPAVVSVVRNEVFFDPFNGPFRSEDSIGTGFIIDGKNGVVLSNRHVVSNEDANYSIVLGTVEETYDVEKVYRDPLNDFAILKINTEGKELPSLKLGDSDSLKKGQTVIAIGNALGQFGNSITKGVVSGLNRGITAGSPFGRTETIENVIQTDAALNPGNSGGPLLNLLGEVVGINVAVSQSAENIGFSIPINSLKPVIEEFNQTGKISRPYLGVEYAQITQQIAEQRSLPIGAFVRRVLPESPADQAGIEPGDIILKINDIRLDDKENTLPRVVSKQKTDEEIEIVVDRNGRELTLKTTLQDLEE